MFKANQTSLPKWKHHMINAVLSEKVVFLLSYLAFGVIFITCYFLWTVHTLTWSE